MNDALKSIGEYVALDKKTANEVRAEAKKKLDCGVLLLMEDITGAPSAAGAFNRFKTEQRRAIKAVGDDLYFTKVEATVRDAKGKTERRTYLVTKHRVASGLKTDDWTVVSWTAPITAEILGREVGDEVEFQAAQHTQRLQFTIGLSAKYGTILPELSRTTYYLLGGQVYIEDEQDLAPQTRTLPKRGPALQYKAAEEFGLSEIIELADLNQRQAMHLPFKETVLVQGPPGSGKTSIGLMRIPCLIDRQWKELGLEQSKDKPFHEVSTMRVLVLNEEMVVYLGKLIRSVGVYGVRVLTLEKFCQQICRDGRTLSGTRVRESPALSRLKLHPEALSAYWAGFRMRVDKYWSRNRHRLLDALTAVGREYGETLANRIDRWVSAIQNASNPDDALPQSINIAHVLRQWREDCRRLRSGSGRAYQQEPIAELLPRLQRISLRLARRLLDRHRIVRCVVECGEFRHLCGLWGDEQSTTSAVEEWLEQARRRQFAESDGVLAAWLATYVSYVPNGSERQSIGAVRSRLTHVLIDEAQDVSPCHLNVIRRLLENDGTITMVGDLRQRITPHGHFERWRELVSGKIKRAVFSVNHRQSQPLGEFVRKLHACLYGKAPLWKASLRAGPLPRLRRQRGNAGLAEAVAEEVRHWREVIPTATVGVLFHGNRWDGLRTLADRVETALQDTLTTVHVAVGSGRAHIFGRTDCAIIATVRETKGLEFDAAVIIDPHRMWKNSLDDIPTVLRNAMYVSASRARQGLSLIIDDRSVLMDGSIKASLYEKVATEKT